MTFVKFHFCKASFAGKRKLTSVFHLPVSGQKQIAVVRLHFSKINDEHNKKEIGSPKNEKISA